MWRKNLINMKNGNMYMLDSSEFWNKKQKNISLISRNYQTTNFTFYLHAESFNFSVISEILKIGIYYTFLTNCPKTFYVHNLFNLSFWYGTNKGVMIPPPNPCYEYIKIFQKQPSMTHNFLEFFFLNIWCNILPNNL